MLNSPNEFTNTGKEIDVKTGLFCMSNSLFKGGVDVKAGNDNADKHNPK